MADTEVVLETGQQYTHNESKRTVTVTGVSNFRVAYGVWVPGVTYRTDDNLTLWTRPINEFRALFSFRGHGQAATPIPPGGRPFGV